MGEWDSVSHSLAVECEEENIQAVAMCGLVTATLFPLGKRNFRVNQ